MVSKSMIFNYVTGIDLVQKKSPTGKVRYWLNCVCWGTSYIVWGLIGESPTAERTWLIFAKDWLRHYGPPEIVVTDGGGEFQGVFAQNLSESGSFHHVTDSHSPWQNGRTEVGGGEIKTRCELSEEYFKPQTDEEQEAMVYETVCTRNRLYNRSGFSPMQRVLLGQVTDFQEACRAMTHYTRSRCRCNQGMMSPEHMRYDKQHFEHTLNKTISADCDERKQEGLERSGRSQEEHW